MEDALNPENLELFAGLAVDAVKSGNGWLILSVALVAVVWAARKFLGDKVPFLKTQAGGALLTLVASFAGALATVLTSGSPMSWVIALGAFKVAFTAAGGWTLVKHLLTLLQGKDPATIKAGAEAAGAKAVESAVNDGTVQSVEDVLK